MFQCVCVEKLFKCEFAIIICEIICIPCDKLCKHVPFDFGISNSFPLSECHLCVQLSETKQVSIVTRFTTHNKPL